MAAGDAAPTRRTQQERSDGTRAKLMEATVSCLVELGYTGTTTTEVSRRAGLSRGAQLHHFPTKNDLVIAAIEYLAERRQEELFGELAALPETGHIVDHIVDLIWHTMQGPLFLAAAELGVASRTDQELHRRLAPFEQQISRTARDTLAALLDTEDLETARQLAEFTLDVLWGLAIQGVVGRDTSRFDHVVEDWKRHLHRLLGS